MNLRAQKISSRWGEVIFTTRRLTRKCRSQITNSNGEGRDGSVLKSLLAWRKNQERKKEMIIVVWLIVVPHSAIFHPFFRLSLSLWKHRERIGEEVGRVEPLIGHKKKVWKKCSMREMFGIAKRLFMPRSIIFTSIVRGEYVMSPSASDSELIKMRLLMGMREMLRPVVRFIGRKKKRRPKLQIILLNDFAAVRGKCLRPDEKNEKREPDDGHPKESIRRMPLDPRPVWEDFAQFNFIWGQTIVSV